MTAKTTRMLKAEELVQLRVRADKTLPIKGTKEFQPSNSWLEKKQIQTALDDRKILLEEERVEKLGTLIKAVWDPEVKIAVVTCRVGRQWNHLGRDVGGKLQLYPEEALFLMEMNCLELMYSGVAISIQQAFTMLLGSDTGCTYNEYQTYVHLVRQGYILLRHCKSVQATRYERQIRLDQHSVGQKRHKSKENISAQEVLIEDGSSGMKNHTDTIKSPLENGKVNNNLKTEDLEIIDVETIEVVDMGDDIIPKTVSTNEGKGEIDETHTEAESVDIDVLNRSSSIISDISSDSVITQSNLRSESMQKNFNSKVNENDTKSDNQKLIEDSSKVKETNVTSVENESRIVSQSYTTNVEVTSSKTIDTERNSGLNVENNSLAELHNVNNEGNKREQLCGETSDSTGPSIMKNKEVPENEGAQDGDHVNKTSNLAESSAESSILKNKEVPENECAQMEDHVNEISTVAENTITNLGNKNNSNKTTSESCNKEKEETCIIIVDDTAADVCQVEEDKEDKTEAVSQGTKELREKESSKEIEEEEECSVDADVVDVSDNSQTSQPEIRLATMATTVKRNVQNKTSSDINDDIEILDIVTVKSDDNEIVEVNENEVPIISTVKSISQIKSRRKSYKKNEDNFTVKNESVLNNSKVGIVNVANNKQLNENIKKVSNINLKKDKLQNASSIIDISEDEMKQSRNNFKTEVINSVYDHDIEIVDLESEDSRPQPSWEEERSRILDSIPSIDGKFVMHVKVPNKDLLPLNVCPQKEDYYIQRWRLNAPGIGGKETANLPHTRNNHWDRDHSAGFDGQINPWIQNPFGGGAGEGGGGNMFGAAGAWNNSPSLVRPPLNEHYQPSLPGVMHLQNLFQQAASVLSVFGNPAWASNGMFGMPSQPAMPYHRKFTYYHRPPWHYRSRPYYRRPYYKRRRQYEPQYNSTPAGLGKQHFASHSNARDGMIPLRIKNDVRNENDDHNANDDDDDNENENDEKPPIKGNEHDNDNDDDVIVCMPSPIKVDIEQDVWISHGSQRHDNNQNSIATGNHVKRRKRRTSGSPRLYDPPKKLRGFIDKLKLETKEEVKNKSHKIEAEDNCAHEEVLLQDNVPPDVKSWRDLKTVLQVVTLDSSSEDEDDVYIVVDDIQGPPAIINEPLVQYEDCNNTDSVLKKLQIIKSVSLDGEKQNEANEKLKFCFDLYIPNAAFRKSSPGLPNYRIIVLGYEDPVPEPREIVMLLKCFEDDVPLLFAVVLPDTVTFLQFGRVDLPVEMCCP